jgi:hypothetical protein
MTGSAETKGHRAEAAAAETDCAKVGGSALALASQSRPGAMLPFRDRLREHVSQGKRGVN